MEEEIDLESKKSDAQRLAEMLADATKLLYDVSQQIPGGFEHSKLLVRELTNTGMPFPEAIYTVAKEIIENKHGKTS